MKNNLFPPTTQRVSFHTCNKINQNIRDKTLACINTYKSGSEQILSDKIENLNHEWDTERVLEANAASVVLLSSVLGYKSRKCRWFLLTGTVGFFLLQHALQGWCPPLPVIRKLGVRTAAEIHHEKTVFKQLRGDFSQNADNADILLATAEKQ